jgi:hypothetical protein
MPTPLADALSSGVQGFSDTAVSQFAVILPVALLLVAGIAVTFMGIRYFRGLVKIYTSLKKAPGTGRCL